MISTLFLTMVVMQTQKAMLVVTDLKVGKVESFPGASFVIGRVRNESGRELQSVVINISFEDKDNNLVDDVNTVFSQAILKPGDVGQFRGQRFSKEPYDHVKLTFTTIAGELLTHRLERRR